MDWSLRTCARKGHITYAPTEPELTERLHVDTAVGEAWRCLRCGDFVPGEPHQRGPANDAPIVLRGQALRDAVVLRLLAAERGIRGLLLFVAAYGIWRFRSSQASMQRVFDSYLPLLKPISDRIGYDITESGPVRLAHEAFALRKGTLLWVFVAVVAYGVLQLTEAIGLWLLRRWGEYVAVIGTSAFLPLEIYELIEKVTFTRAGAFVINVAAVAYLLYTKRLFGVRGGRAAHEAERHSASLLEIESAAVDEDLDHSARSARSTSAAEKGSVRP